VFSVRRVLIRVSLAVAPVAALLCVAGCRATQALSEREVVVHFQVGTSLADKARVAEGCSTVPRASPEPLPASADSPQARLNEVRFRVDTASQQDIQRLYACLRRFPSAINAEQVDQ
jgi:hypothetical protein